MLKSKLRLLVVAAFLTAAALLPSAAQAVCFFYCWHVSVEVTCCRTSRCDIVCSGE
jgi:hypothetical protein